MNFKKLFITYFVIFFLVNLNAFSLGSKIIYLEKLKKEAIQLEQDGYYNQSIELSKKIKSLSLQYTKLIYSSKEWYKLQHRITVAKQIEADKYAPEEYKKAVDFFKKAEKNIVNEDYEKANFQIVQGMRNSELAIEKTKAIFEKLQNQKISNKNQNNNTKVVLNSNKPIIEVAKINSYYIVRLIPKRRDSLWRIAEYANIYNNPWKWRIIYNANRNIIKDPDLIYPNQKLIIPPEPVDFDEE